MRYPDEQKRNELIELLFELSKTQDIFRNKCDLILGNSIAEQFTEKKKKSDVFLKLKQNHLKI